MGNTRQDAKKGVIMGKDSDSRSLVKTGDALAARGLELLKKIKEKNVPAPKGDIKSFQEKALSVKKEETHSPVAVNSKEFRNSMGMEFVFVSKGGFLMGSPENEEDRFDDERLHEVRLTRDFYLGKYFVTQAQWMSVMGENPSCFKGDNHPVENVSWEDVQVFIHKLNQKEGTDKYRLPTEAEWEYAARAGTRTAYSFGNDVSQLERYAWYSENSGKTTHPVGEKLPNAWGLYDMHGNVWEWVQDWWENDYPEGPVADPEGPSSGELRVVRGGGWISSAMVCRSAYRNHNSPDDRNRSLGFRLAFTPERQ